ncbi:protein CBFA2T3-like [Arapaima gigas]
MPSATRHWLATCSEERNGAFEEMNITTAALPLFARPPLQADGDQMWAGWRPGTGPEQLGEIENNSIPGDRGNYRGGAGEETGGEPRAVLVCASLMSLVAGPTKDWFVHHAPVALVPVLPLHTRTSCLDYQSPLTTLAPWVDTFIP